MTFAPSIPAGGVVGLRLLERSYDAQFEAFSRSPEVQRDIDAFLERAGTISTAEELVGDTQLLRVGLGAFGLEEELPKRALIRRVLEENTFARESLVNRLVDPAWKNFSEAIGFGDFGGLLNQESVRRDIAERYRVRQFERAVGEVDVDLRLVLNFRREIGDIASASDADRSGWFRIVGSEPLRRVVFGALNLPDSFARLDIDEQATRLSERAEQVFGNGSPAIFADNEAVETAVNRFLLNAQIASGPGPSAPGATALTLLQSSGLGTGASQNLFASRL
ncbi:MAG: DUF1217 domain-containing protein [Pseudomonadota bacterium]